MLSRADSVRIEIYDIKGEKVGDVLNDFLNAGNHTINREPKGLPSGVYYYKIITSDTTLTKKIILLK